MNELIPISSVVIAGQTVQAVDARKLHAWLQSGYKFAVWISERIAKYGFVEGRDYVSFSVNPEKPSGGRPSKEYALTLDMGKQLGMVENNERGREIRLYFLDCEDRAKQAAATAAAVAAHNIPRTYIDALRVVLLQAEQAERYELQLEQRGKELAEAAPKVAFVDSFVNADGLYGLKNAGKALGQRPNKFIQALKADGYLYHEGAKLVPYQRWVERGLFEVKAHQREEWAGLQTYITPKGLTYFAEKLQPKQAELPMESPAEVD